MNQSKKRPVIFIKSENEQNDFVCFQITSKNTQEKLHIINNTDIIDGNLKLRSSVKYDKCFTLNSELVEKKLASVSNLIYGDIKKVIL